MQDLPSKLSSGKGEEEKNADSSSSQVHYVPFKVEFEGSANVTTKFSSKTTLMESTSQQESDLKNQFRGKPLSGKHLQLPNDYEGIIVVDAAKDLSENKEVKFNRVGGFNHLTYWNWDKPPSDMDAPVKLMDWLELSQMLHEPIEGDL